MSVVIKKLSSKKIKKHIRKMSSANKVILMTNDLITNNKKVP